MSSPRPLRQKMDRWVEQSSKSLHTHVHRMHALQRFPMKVKLALLLPVVTYLFLFQIAGRLPPDIRPEIDVKTLPMIENAITFGYSLQHWPRPLLDDPAYTPLVSFLDLLAAFVYVIHFGFWAIFALYLFSYYKRNENALGPVLQPWTFFWIWGLMNLTAITTQLAWPTAPPWYNEMYGYAPANYSMHGNPAGLGNADELISFNLFSGIYGNSPVVFGSFPSLHAAWPVVLCLFSPTAVMRATMAVYALLVWWAALYLNHHYLIDLLGAFVYVIFFYIVGTLILEIVFRHLKPSWLLRKKRRRFREKKSRNSDEVAALEMDYLVYEDDSDSEKGEQV